MPVLNDHNAYEEDQRQQITNSHNNHIIEKRAHSYDVLVYLSHNVGRSVGFVKNHAEF